MKRLYENWREDLNFWREKLRHLRWVSNYRMHIISSLLDLKWKTVLDLGSGPQFTADLLREAGAEVVTLDKFAPCDLHCDINEDFIVYLGEREFDLVVMGAVIRYVQHKEIFLGRLSKILKPGGLIFLDEFIHSWINDLFLDFMNLVGAMEIWPKEYFTPLESLERTVSKIPSLCLDTIYSCWPTFYLKGKYPLSVWYTLIIKKCRQKHDDNKKQKPKENVP